MKMKIIFLVLAFQLMLFADSVPAQEWVGQWSGVARDGSEQTRLELTLERAESGLSASMTLPDIGVSGWPAQSVEPSGDTLQVTFPSDSGPQRMTLSINAQSITGTWRERRFENAALLELTRVESMPLITEQRFLIEGPAGALGASLIMPVCADKCAAVVFLHGSGPQPRDSNRFAAHALAEQGIASMIYDKRGVGDSEGELTGVTFDDLAADAIAIAEMLRRQPGISAVGFFGHSQGGWIAPLAGAQWAHTAFVITSAGPAVPPSRETQWDVVRRLRNASASKEAEAQARHIIQLWHEGVRSGTWSAFDQALSAAEDEPWFTIADFSVFSNRPGEAFMHSYRAFMDYDPIPALSSLTAPMLAILAPEDESIDAMETESILRALSDSGYDIRLKIYPGYDHSMRKLSSEGSVQRWPEHPEDYYAFQAEFIHTAKQALLK